LHGADWLGGCLDAWRDAGARRFVTLRDLTTAFGVRLQATESAGGCELEVDGVPADAHRLVAPVRVELPGGNVPSRVRVRVGNAARGTLMETGSEGVLRIPLGGFEVRP
jgi:hypothetical protein